MPALKREFFPHYNYEDYFSWEGDWELIDGVPFAMAPSPVKNHQMIVLEIGRELLDKLDCLDCETLLDSDWKLSSSTILKPDVALVCDDKNEKYIAKTPELIFEVISPSTAKKDETLKFSLYEQEGVGYYVLVYPEELIAKVYKNRDGKFQKVGDYDTQTLSFEDLKCALDFDFATIFKRFRK